MAQSQKHCGLSLVPWFNNDEWNDVYKLIYTEEKLETALRILKIWKSRTPLLSAGVEGTLIILEGLCTDNKILSDNEICNIYSTSLIRFLNLCATNSDTQGTFYKIAKQHNLPKWLINIRHEIAHSHTIPSKSILIIASKYCLNWLKINYWNVQQQYMSDVVAESKPEIREMLLVYTHLKLFYYKHPDGKPELDNDLWKIIEKISNKTTPNFKKILSYIEKYLENINNIESSISDYLCELLVNGDVIMSTNLISTSIYPEIPKPFIILWDKLFNFIYRCNIACNLLRKLFDFILNLNTQEIKRQFAFLWMKEICKVLNQNENTFSLNNPIERELFRKILKAPNELSLNFMPCFFKLYKVPDCFINDIIKISKNFFKNYNKSNNGKVFTKEDLNIVFSKEYSHCIKKHCFIKNNEKIKNKIKFKLIKDKKLYKNCPLGVLPNQSRNKNPTICL